MLSLGLIKVMGQVISSETDLVLGMSRDSSRKSLPMDGASPLG